MPSVIVVTPNGFGTRDITDVYDGSDYNRYADSVWVECEAKAGGTVSGWVTRRSGEYVIPDSSDYVYSTSELAAMNLNDAELCIAWNEPFARKGYHFSNSSLQNYFESCSWYHDSGSKPDLSSDSAGAKNGEKLKSLLSNSKWRNLVTY